MDKQLIERIVFEEKSKLQIFGMDEVCAELVVNCLAAIAAQKGGAA